MLCRLSRITKEQILRVSKEGVSYHSPSFLLKVLPGSEKALGTVIVSKKISKKAVLRNRIKRRVRHAYTKCGFSQPLLFTLTVKKDLSKAIFLDIVSELATLLARVA